MAITKGGRVFGAVSMQVLQAIPFWSSSIEDETSIESKKMTETQIANFATAVKRIETLLEQIARDMRQLSKTMESALEELEDL